MLRSVLLMAPVYLLTSPHGSLSRRKADIITLKEHSKRTLEDKQSTAEQRRAVTM